MITRFFNTSKPIHIIIITFFTLIVFVITSISNIGDELSFNLLFKEFSKYGIILISIFTLTFLVRKNKLTNNNSFELLVYGFLLSSLPISMQDSNVLISNFFILLALRRIISLRSNLKTKKKLFDAAFWIAIASLFYFWAILFFVLIIMAVLLYSLAHFKNWIIPFIGVLVVVLITMSYSIVVYGNFDVIFNYLETTSLNFSGYNIKPLVYQISIIVILSLWPLFFYMINLKRKQKTSRPAHILIFIAFLIGAAIIIIAPQKNGSEFLFVFSPLAIIIANYLESIKKYRISEFYVWLLILTPVVLLML